MQQIIDIKKTKLKSNFLSDKLSNGPEEWLMRVTNLQI